MEKAIMFGPVYEVSTFCEFFLFLCFYVSNVCSYGLRPQ
jgi:hypothetical protein